MKATDPRVREDGECHVVLESSEPHFPGKALESSHFHSNWGEEGTKVDGRGDVISWLERSYGSEPVEEFYSNLEERGLEMGNTRFRLERKGGEEEQRLVSRFHLTVKPDIELRTDSPEGIGVRPEVILGYSDSPGDPALVKRITWNVGDEAVEESYRGLLNFKMDELRQLYGDQVDDAYSCTDWGFQGYRNLEL